MKAKSVLGIIITGVVITGFSLHNGLKNVESKLHGTNGMLPGNHDVQLSSVKPEHGTHHFQAIPDEGGVKNLAGGTSSHSLAGTGIGNGLAPELGMHDHLLDPGTHGKLEGEVPGHSLALIGRVHNLLNGLLPSGDPSHGVALVSEEFSNSFAGTIIGNGFINNSDPAHGKLVGEIPGHSLNNFGPDPAHGVLTGGPDHGHGLNNAGTDPAHGQSEGEVPGHGFALIEGVHDLLKNLIPGGDPRNELVHVGQDPAHSVTAHSVTLTGEHLGNGFANDSEDPANSFADAVNYI